MELQLEDLETAATEDELAAETAALPDADGTVVPAQAAFTKAVPRSSPARAHRHRRTRKLSLLRLGEAVEAGRGHYRNAGGDPAAVEGDFRRYARSSPCRTCETITQPPAPFHVTPRGFAGANLLAMILFEKFGQHRPAEPPERTLQARRHRSERVDAGRPGWRQRPCNRFMR